MTYEDASPRMVSDQPQGSGLDAPRPAKPVDPRQAIREVLRRWHPEGFTAETLGRAGFDQGVTDLYFVARRWGDIRLIESHLVALERDAGLRPSAEARIRRVAAELIMLGLSAATPQPARRRAHGQ